MFTLDPFLMLLCPQEGWKMKKMTPSKFLLILTSFVRNTISDKDDIYIQVILVKLPTFNSNRFSCPQLPPPSLWWFWGCSWSSSSFLLKWGRNQAHFSSWSSSSSSCSLSSPRSGSSGGSAVTDTVLLPTFRSRTWMSQMRKELRNSWRRHY